MSNFRLAAGALCIAAILPAGAGAFDFVVTRYDDPVPSGCVVGDCSLREAVVAANVASDADRILLSAGTYRLTLPGSLEDASLTGDLDVLKDLEILGVGAGMTRIDSAGMGDRTLRAAAAGLDFVLRKVSVVNSDETGVSLGPGNHTIEDCEFRGNGFAVAGAGIQMTVGHVLTLRRSTLSGNGLAGLLAVQGTATLENVTLSGNSQVELSLSTESAFSCTHCTISDSGDSEAEVAVGNSTLTISNSIVAGNCQFLTGGSNDSLGGNVESAGNTCQFNQGSDVVNVAPSALALAPLADNGGGTSTHLPGALSAANGAANDALCLLEDQRGVVRETNCESGAVELTTLAVPSAIFVDGVEQGNSGAWSVTVP